MSGDKQKPEGETERAKNPPSPVYGAEVAFRSFAKFKYLPKEAGKILISGSNIGYA